MNTMVLAGSWQYRWPQLATFACILLESAASSLKQPYFEEGSLRFGGGNTDAGRVEIYRDGKWGWLCLGDETTNFSRGWSWNESQVVCKQMGMRRGLGTMRMANGPSHLAFPVTSVSCSGSEETLAQCRVEAQGFDNPACKEDSKLPAAAGVRCSNFFPEEQPPLILGNSSLHTVLLDIAASVACDHLPGTPRQGQNLPTFSCTVRQHDVDSTGIACTSDNHCSENAWQGIPNPFLNDETLGAFVFQEPMQTSLERASRRLGEVRATWRGGPGRLPAQWTEIGVDLSRSLKGDVPGTCSVQPEGTLGCNDGGSKAAGVAAVRASYFSPIARLLFDLDSEVIGLSGRKVEPDFLKSVSDAAAANIYTALERDGVALLGDIGLPAEARAEAIESLGESANADVLAAVRSPLPLFESWLRANQTLQDAIAAYFGGHAMLHGYKVVHLPPKVSPKAFIAAHWHHDRAGRRLKLFILLADVDPVEGHPTEVAKGSHRLSYYWHEDFEQSRYKDGYVRRKFDTIRLAGPAGSAYVFDTNALHRGTPEGSLGRNVIVVEYHQAAKCSVLSTMGLNIPCPSGDQKPLNWYFGVGSGVASA